MSEEPVPQDDQSHYEISLTAGQAFVAFVLLLLSLAASFAFGLTIGKGQVDDRLIVRKEPAIITEAGTIPAKKADGGKIVELGVAEEDFKAPEKTESAAPEPVITEEPPATDSVAPAPVDAPPVRRPNAGESPAAPRETTPATPVYAQLLSTGDQKVAETLAAKLIENGFTSAYVDRTAVNDKGPLFRVRVRFPSEPDARAAEAKLRQFSNDVWITKAGA